MGYDGGFVTREEMLAVDLPQPADVIDYEIDDNVLWTIEMQDDRPQIRCYLMREIDGLWFHKDIPVADVEAPVASNCPLRFLDKVPDCGGESTLWRRRVRYYDTDPQAN